MKISYCLIILLSLPSFISIEQKDTVREFINALNNKDRKALDTLLSDDFTFTTQYGTSSRTHFLDTILPAHFNRDYKFKIKKLKPVYYEIIIHTLGQYEICKYLECDPIPTQQTFSFEKNKIESIELDTLMGYSFAEKTLAYKFNRFEIWRDLRYPNDNKSYDNTIKRLKEYQKEN